jgi:hypothetical protein
VPERKQVDWEAIEREFRAGQLSVSEIGRQHGVSHTAINKKAKAQGWSRNLAAKVKEAVSAKLVSDGVSTASARETIEAAATRVVEVVRSHRNDIANGRKIAQTLFAELIEGSDPENRETIEVEIEDETKGDANGKRRAMMLRAVALPSRASVLLALSSAMKNFIQLERQAFNIEGSPGDDDSSDTQRSVNEISAAIEGKLARIASPGGASSLPQEPVA